MLVPESDLTELMPSRHTKALPRLIMLLRKLQAGQNRRSRTLRKLEKQLRVLEEVLENSSESSQRRRLSLRRKLLKKRSRDGFLAL